MTLLEFWALLVEYRKSILALSLSLAVLVGVHSMFVRPIYSSSVILSPLNVNDGNDLVSRISGQLGGLAGLGGLASGVGAAKNEAVALLTSRGFTEQFIRDQNLLPELFAAKWDAANKKWRPSDDGPPTLEDGFRKFDLRIRFVQDDEKSGLVTLEIRWTDRVRAAQWANALVDALNKRIRERTVDEAERSIVYLNHQLEGTTVIPVQQSIFSLLEKNIQTVMFAKVRDEFAFRIIDRAMPSDEDKFVSPLRVLRVCVALIVGLILGVLLALARSFVRAERRQQAPRSG